MMALANVCLDMRRIKSTFQTSLFLSMTGLNDSPASLSSLTMEGWQGYIAKLRERRRQELMNYTHLPITPLTSQWSPSLHGSIDAFGATRQPTPSSRMPSMTSTTGGSSPKSTTTSNMTKKMPTLSRNWTSWRQSDRALSKTAPSPKSASSHPASQKKLSISLFNRLQAPFSQDGKGEACSSPHTSPSTKDKDIFM